jgi:O-antigen ligase
MRLLKYIFIVFILLFPIAEIGRVQLLNGIAISVNDVLLLAVIIVWQLTHFIKKQSFSIGKLSKPILIFSGIGLISLFLNLPNLGINNAFASSLYLMRWVAYALIYVIVNEFEPKFKQKIAYALLISGSIVVALGYLQFFFYPSLRNLYYLGWDEHLYRMFSSFLDPNFAGVFFVIFFIFVLSFVFNFLKQKSYIKTLFTLAISLATLIAIYLTYSRSALLMLAISVITYLIVKGQKKLIAVALLAIVLIIFILPKSFTTEGTNFLRAVSSEARVKTAQESLVIIQKSPIYGVGFNAYRFAANKLGIVTGQEWQTSHGGAGTDNSFLFVLATTGIIGLIIYLNLLHRIIILGLNNLRKNKYAIVLISSLAGLLISSLFINSLFYVFILEWVWILASFTEKN